MKLFYGEIQGDSVIINDEEQQHIVKVLRMKEGEEIHVTDGKGKLASGKLVIEGKKAGMDIAEIKTDLPDFNPKLHIAIAPTKNIDRIEFFVEKAVEMGVSEISIIQTEKTERKNINIDKIRKQSIAASKQSLRFHFPVIHDFVKLTDFLKNVNPEHTFVAHCHESLERIELNHIPSLESYTILIGPEGDFSEKEIHYLLHNKIRAISLGNQRLRTETAGVFIASWNYFNLKLIINNT
ncbi:RsmE family RNA methyltransferase [Chryseobacterium daecheongense]|uniref:Ribosomal RNA small subunit methyltransferase E n=1 Tax=Chryseobacterium daecheongense TaxID=192389 RepID=A0A3N0VXL3_9FLAO|nr:RsmE family RNA methyltransferase [Chryseobacterium daecheongense]ROH97556.1 16S rRNA (uracil(1498)-N(3))-methyltransferase [Chryseobacterium daecheongense]TDX93295.1 16S rRNA (uracil1498-N3)-methyltransferase [Chryseobacterium daecheongense]